jgi:hypothetical protein
MQIPVAALPVNSPNPGYAYNVAESLVNPALNLVPIIYTLAVYNLAGDNLINYCPDQPGQTFFTAARASYGCNSFVPGVIGASADEGTSESIITPDFMKTLLMANLQQLKTPYGRQYMAFAQSAGTLWGIT